jgi:pyruvate-formate lyase
MGNDTQQVAKLARKADPSTFRTQQLRQNFIAKKPSICAERSVLVTESYKTTEAQPPVLRQAMAFEKVLSEVPLWIQEGELLVANIASRQRGAFLFPEYDSLWIEGEYDTISTRAGDPWYLGEADKIQLKDCMDYWRGKNLAAIADALTPDEVRQAEANTFVNVVMGKQGGIGHVAADFEGVISRGLNAHIEDAEAHLARLDLANPDDFEKFHFLKAVIITDKAVITWANRFAALAREKAEASQDPERKRELEELAEVCEWVPANPARNFREALQTVAFIFAAVQIESSFRHALI